MAVHIESILICAVDTFLPFDLDSVSAATINILVAMAFNHGLVDNGPQLIMTAYTIFGHLIASGNQVAALRKGELDNLRKMLEKLNPTSLSAWPPGGFPCQQSSEGAPSPNQGKPVPQTPILDLPISPSLNADLSESLTTANIMEMANSIEDIDTDWVSQIIGHDSIW